MNAPLSPIPLFQFVETSWSWALGWCYSVEQADMTELGLDNHRTLARGSGFNSKPEAQEAGAQALQRYLPAEAELIEGDILYAQTKVQRADDRAMQLQVQANRRDVHSMGACQ